MLSINKKKSIEESVLASFLLYPSIGFSLVDKLKPEHFSSTDRRDLFKYILKEKQQGKQVVIQDLEGDLRHSALQCIGKEHLVNLNRYIEELIEEGYINEMYKLGQEIIAMSINDKSLLSIVKKTKRTLLNIDLNKDDEHSISMKDAVKNIKTGVVNHKEYKIGIKSLDKYMPVSSQSITVIGGNEGAFKTKLMIFIVRKLLKHYNNISVLWYSMEDPSDKIIRGWISQEEFITDQELKHIDYASLIPKDIVDYDIEFVTKSSTIKEIGENYARFRESRENKFCILIIDNIMKIIPSNPKIDPDMEILREVESWNIKTSNKEAAVYMLHHFTKAPLEARNKENAYQPKISDLRGSGRYKDAVTNAILVNPMYSHQDIIEIFEGYEDFISHFYTIIVAKNRNNKKKKIQMLAYPAYNWFFEI